MKKILLSLVLTVAASTSLASNYKYCGEIYFPFGCDMDVCKVTLKTEVNGQEHLIGIGSLVKNGETLKGRQGALDGYDGRQVCLSPTENYYNKTRVDVLPDGSVRETPIQDSPTRDYIYEAELLD